MHDEAARKLIEETFNQAYDHDRFRTFIRNLTKGYEEKGKSGIVYHSFKDSIQSVFRIGKFVDADENEIDILTVTLAEKTSLDRARTLQRNFVAKWLSSAERSKEAALVAFVSNDEEAWRFSLVRREAGITLNMRGKAKATADFSPARRFSFLVGKGERTHTVKRQLHKFLTTDEKPTLKVLESAFNIETVTDEFFKEYRELFNRVNETIVEYLKEHPDIQAHFTEKDIEAADFAKRLLGQIVFLYFLQKKGWLGVPRNGKWGEGSRTFLRDLYNKAGSEKKNFFDSYLKHLFYDALNHDRSDVDHYYSMFNCRIPFLNGGLFEPYHDYKWEQWDIDLPNSLFHKLGQSLFGDDGNGILDVFDRYNFTVAEDEPLEREVAIDPEMLGKVFENLLEVKDRKAKGTYYTPREIVHYMCQESLIACLSSKCPALDKGELEDFIRYGDLMLEYDAKVLTAPTQTYKDFFLGGTIRDNLAMVDTALATVKVCDPAIGSGAFPVGMMTEIVRARKVLALHLKKDAKPYELKRQTIQDCLYGVDLDPGAIEIAKLRLWLSLVVDEDDFREIQALPNLDYKIMQGNSLLQTYEGIKLFDDTLLQKHDNNVRRKRQLEDDMRGLQARLMSMLTRSTKVTNPKDKKALEKAIQQKQKEIDALNVPEKAETAAPLLDTQANASGLADKLRDLHIRFFQIANPVEKKRLKAKVEDLEMQLVETSLKELHQNKAAPLLEKIRKLHRANVKPYFLWKLHFSEVFAGENGGFDIVIANPPYGANFSSHDKIVYKDSYESFSVRAESYVLFIELGIERLKNGGVLSYIVPDTYLNLGFTKKIREYLLSRTRIREIFALSASVFETATVDTTLLFAEKSDVVDQLITNNASIKIISKKSTELSLSKPDRHFVTNTKEWQTSSVFNIISDRSEMKVIEKIDGARKRISDIAEIFSGVKVYEVGKGSPPQTNLILRDRPFTADHKKDKNFSPFFDGKHVGRYAVLWNNNNWIHYGRWLAAPRGDGVFQGNKILIRKIVGEKLLATFVNETVYCNTLLFILKLNPNEKISYMCVLGILNSSLIGWYYKKKFQISDEDTFPQIMIRDILQFPIPDIATKIDEAIAELVCRILDLKKQNKVADTGELEAQIDTEVYRLYDLTPDEIAIIKSATHNTPKKAV